jgi:GTP-binding protein HflX
VLRDIDAGDVPEQLVFNKADLAPDAKQFVDLHPGSVALSAVTGEGIPELLGTVGARIRALTELTELHIPFDRADAVAVAHREGEVVVETADEDGFRLRVRLEPAGRGRLAEFVVGSVGGPR